MPDQSAGLPEYRVLDRDKNGNRELARRKISRHLQQNQKTEAEERNKGRLSVTSVIIYQKLQIRYGIINRRLIMPYLIYKSIPVCSSRVSGDGGCGQLHDAAFEPRPDFGRPESASFTLTSLPFASSPTGTALVVQAVCRNLPCVSRYWHVPLARAVASRVAYWVFASDETVVFSSSRSSRRQGRRIGTDPRICFR